jgi:hypothetical protein
MAWQDWLWAWQNTQWILLAWRYCYFNSVQSFVYTLQTYIYDGDWHYYQFGLYKLMEVSR